jgi:hypothetical protein
MTDYRTAADIRPWRTGDDWRAFTKELLKTLDCDPVYVALARSGWKIDQQKRFMVGLVTYYSKGVAAYLSAFEGEGYWKESLRIYPKCRRRTMRRHFRGELGLKALDAWMSRWRRPEFMMDELIDQPPTWRGVRAWTKGVPQMGPYFTWKLADLYEVATEGETAVDFTGCDSCIMDSPRKGAKEMLPHIENGEEALRFMADSLIGLRAPPFLKRPADLQEMETAACNWSQAVVKDGYVMGQTAAEYIADSEGIESKANREYAKALLDFPAFSEEYMRAVIKLKKYH